MGLITNEYGEVKTGTFVFLGLAILLVGIFMVVSVVGSIFSGQKWNREVESYFQLSDQSSNVDTKLKYLEQYREAIHSHNLCKGNAAWFFQTPYKDLAKQCEVLDSLIARLQDLKEMSPTSLEYQQALKQITSDEYRGFDSCVFLAGWHHQSVARFWFGNGGSCQDGAPHVTASN